MVGSGKEIFLTAITPLSTSKNVLSPSSEGEHIVHWEGRVRKKGDWLPRWEERYLVLEGTTLTYYNNREEAHSSLNLKGRMIISKVRSEHYGKSHGFLLETVGHKHFHLCCASELEKCTWVELMTAALMQIGTVTSTISSMLSPLRIDLDKFYSAYKTLIMTHQASSHFFPKLSRDIVFTSNYAPTVPFWGEYHGLDGVLHFFSIVYETVQVLDFTVTDIAQCDGNTAVIVGRESMRNRHNKRTFTQVWQHTIVFANDGRVKRLEMETDAVAAAACFGTSATSQLNLPYVAPAASTAMEDSPPGTLHIHAMGGEDLLGSVSNDLFLTFHLIVDDIQETDAFQTKAGVIEKEERVTWDSNGDLEFAGVGYGLPAGMIVQAWSTEPGMEADGRHLVGVTKVDLAPFLALASSSKTVRESVINCDIVRGDIPQWYPLLSPDFNKTGSAGRVQLRISFSSKQSSILHSRSSIDTVSSINSDPHIDAALRTPSLHTFTRKRRVSRQMSYRDTRRDNHTFNVGTTSFDIPTRYQLIKAVGQGYVREKRSLEFIIYFLLVGRTVVS